MGASERQPGAPAPESGLYEELNIFGTPTGRTAALDAGQTLPPSPRCFTWRPLTTYPPHQLRARAEEYRRLAATARTQAVAESLADLAARFDALAEQRARESAGPRAGEAAGPRAGETTDGAG